MDIDLNSNRNSIQVGNSTVLIGYDPFLPQPDSPTVTLSLWMKICIPHDHPQLLQSTHQKISPNPPHPYLEADICLDTESKQILQTLLSPLDKDLPLTDLGPIDPDIFASPPPKRRKRKVTPPMTLTPPNRTNNNILHCRVATLIPTFIPPTPPQRNDSLV